MTGWPRVPRPKSIPSSAPPACLDGRSRRCNAYYGSPPKLLARKYRALRASIALAKGGSNSEALADGGFYDQSHFIREIKAFTGVTPRRFADDLPTLASLTLKRSDFSELGPLITRS